jgi:hypothetical protein
MIGMRATENLTGHRLSVRRTVLDHLRHRGIIGVDDRRVTDGSPLALGVSGVTVDPGGVVAIDGDRCIPTHRTLSDLLGTDGYFADRTALTARQDYDPVLYHAIRDFLPPREKASKHCVPAGPAEHTGRDHLFADLVVYQPGILPGDEPFRSTGHWNLPGQLEIFQTLTGRVLMLVGGQTRDGVPFLYEQVCGPGDLMAVPFGIWHVTYVLDGPAVVFNLMTEVGDAGQVVAHPGEEKYRRASPIAVTARRRSGRHEYVGEGLRSWGRPLGAPRTEWLQSLLAPGESLADLHLYASPSRLAALQRLAWEAYGRCWPHHGGFQATT